MAVEIAFEGSVKFMAVIDYCSSFAFLLYLSRCLWTSTTQRTRYISYLYRGSLAVLNYLWVTTPTLLHWPPWGWNHQLQPLITQFDRLMFLVCCLHNPLTWTCRWGTEPLLYNYSVQTTDSRHLSISAGALFSLAEYTIDFWPLRLPAQSHSLP